MLCAPRPERPHSTNTPSISDLRVQPTAKADSATAELRVKICSPGIFQGPPTTNDIYISKSRRITTVPRLR